MKLNETTRVFEQSFQFIYFTTDIWPCNGDGFAVDIYSRDEWGVRDPDCIDTMSTPVEYIFIHRTDGSECNCVSECGEILLGIQNYYMDSLGMFCSEWKLSFQIVNSRKQCVPNKCSSHRSELTHELNW